MKTIVMILGLVLVIGLASAIYPGETIIEEHNLGTSNLNYLFVGNTSVMNVFPMVTINSTHVEIFIPEDMPTNDFIIVFVENQTNEIIKEIHIPSGGGGGGGTKTIYKDRNITFNHYIEEEVEVEVPGETIEIEKQTTSKLLLGLVILLLLSAFTIIFIQLKNNKKNISEENHNL